jgi:tRNA pseudouridine55 synthase
MPATKVYMHEASWVSHDLPRESVLKMTVRGGYYVRALARDLGRSLGCGAHLTKLHRAAIGPWIDPGPGRPVEIHGREILPWTPVYILSDQDIGDLRRHKITPLTGLLPPDWPLPDGFPAGDPVVRGFHQGRFCFLLEAMHDSRQLRVIAPLPGGL